MCGVKVRAAEAGRVASIGQCAKFVCKKPRVLACCVLKAPDWLMLGRRQPPIGKSIFTVWDLFLLFLEGSALLKDFQKIE